MRLTVLLLFVTCLIASCQWSPERDNPWDPEAVGPDPLPPNQAPQIDTFYATTHCYNNNPDRVREYELVCQISDIDNNLGVDLLIPVYFVEDNSLETLDSLGIMGSDPIRQAFVYRGNKNNLPKPDQSLFTFQIKAVDDSGATTIARTSFVNSWYESYPSLSIPSGTNMPPTALQDTVPRLSWSPLSMVGASSYKITIYKRAIFKVWERMETGIEGGDTVIYLGTDDLESTWNNEQAWYAWFVTVYNDLGNSATSLPGWFVWAPPLPTPIEQSFREEQNDN